MYRQRTDDKNSPLRAPSIPLVLKDTHETKRFVNDELASKSNVLYSPHRHSSHAKKCYSRDIIGINISTK